MTSLSGLQRFMAKTALATDASNKGLLGRLSRRGFAAFVGLSILQPRLKLSGCGGLPTCWMDCHEGDRCWENDSYCWWGSGGCWDDGMGTTCCDVTCEFSDCICEWAT